MSKETKVKGRRLKFGMLATGTTVILLAIVIIINAFATILLDRYPVSIDITKEQIFQMKDTSIDYAKSIDSEISINILASKSGFEAMLTNYINAGAYIDQTNELFKKLTQYNHKIKLNYLDIDKNPDFVAKYPDEKLSATSILIQGEMRYKLLTIDQLFNMQANGQQQYFAASSKAEETIMSAVMYVTDKAPVNAVVIAGHNERSLGDSAITGQNAQIGLAYYLGLNNYEVKTVKLLTEQLSTDSAIVIIAAPTLDYTDGEIKKLNDYLYNGGKFGKKVVYLASATQPKLPKLEAFLKEEWGVSVGDGTLIETDQNKTAGVEGGIALKYADEKYASIIQDQNTMPLMAVASKPLTTEFEEKGNRKTSVLFQTNNTAVVKPSKADDKWSAKNGKKGEYPVGILATRSGVYNNDNVESTVVVSTLSVMNDAMAYYNSNQQYTMNLFDSLTERKSGITILPSTVETSSLGLNVGQRNLYTVFFMVIIPLSCLVAGLIIWLRRRHK